MNRIIVFALTVAGSLCAASSVQAALITYSANLSGPNESPANASPGTGHANMLYNDVLHTMEMIINFSGLTGTTTASHIHSATASPFTGTAGVATQTPTFVNFPLGVTSGSYDQIFDMTLASTWNASFVTANGGTPTGAEAALIAGINAGKSYLNIHTTTFTGGEIRGFLSPVPEPSSLALGAAGLVGLVVLKLRRKSH